MNRDIIELREVVTKLVPLLSGKGLKVTQRGSRAYVKTDMKTLRPVEVNIPNIPDNASSEFVRAIQGFIDHEVAHVLVTDWKFYGAQALSSSEKSGINSDLFTGWHNIIEDTMIEREIVKIFPGSARNISEVRKWFLQNITEKALKTAVTDKDRFNYLMVPAMRALAGHEEMKEFMDTNGYWSEALVDVMIKGLSPEFLKKIQAVSTTRETLELTKELYAVLTQPSPPASGSDGKGEQEADSSGKSDKKSKQKPKREKGADTDEGDSGEGGSSAEGDPGEDAEDAGASGKTSSEDPRSEDPGDGSDAGRSGDPAEEDQDEASDAGGSEGDDDDDDGAGGDESDGDDGDEEAEGETDAGASESADADDDDADDGSDEEELTETAKESSDCGESETSEAAGTPENEGDGVGTSASETLFDVDPEKLKELDLSGAMSKILSEMAEEVMEDSSYTAYTRDFDLIEPLTPPPGHPSDRALRALDEDTQQMIGRMQKDVERMMASRSHVIRTPGHRRGRLHAASLYRVSQGDPRVFTQKEEHNSLETAVMLLVDNSGSMSGKKCDLAMVSAYALCQTLDRVKVPNMVMGFTTGGRIPHTVSRSMWDEIRDSKVNYDRVDPLSLPIYKTFDERVTSTVKARIAYMRTSQPGLAGNIDGESLQYAAEFLARRQEKRKVMIVFSDGQPVGGRRSGPHLKWVVKNLGKIGIECIGIGIMSTAVSSYYPKHVVLRDLEKLPGEVMGEIKRLLSGH